MDAFEFCSEDMIKIMKKTLKLHKNIRASVTLNATLESKEGIPKTVNLFSPFCRVYNKNYIIPTLAAASDYISLSMHIFCDGMSGWKLISINHLELRNTLYKPGRGKGFIALPKEIPARNFINIKGNDSLCFIRSILFAINENSIRLNEFPNKTYSELSQLQKRKLKRIYQNPKTYEKLIKENSKSKKIDFTGCFHGVTLEQISVFELKNSEISVSVYGCKGKDFYNIKPALEKKIHVNLLLLKKPILFDEILPSSSDELSFDFHFVNIWNINSALRQPEYYGKVKKRCQFCHNFFPNIEKHQTLCSVHAEKIIKFPNQPNFEFKRKDLFEEIPMKIIFQFQYAACREHIMSNLTNLNSPTNLSVIGYSYVVIGPKNKVKNEFLDQKTYFGSDAIQHFLLSLFEMKEKLARIIRCLDYPMTFTFRDEYEFENSSFCQICKTNFNEDGVKKVRDHDHITTLYRRALCSNCNILVRLKDFPICIGHGIKKKDLFSILTSATANMLGNPKIICKGSDEIVSLTINDIRFFDSDSFLMADLDSLIARQKKGYLLENFDKIFPYLFKIFQDLSQKDVHLLTSKFAIPSMLHLNENALNELDFPCEEYFVDPITELKSSRDEWISSKQIYNRFKCKNIRDFLKVVLEVRVLLHASVIKTFVEYCMKHLDLDPLGTVSLSSYSWHVVMSKVHEKYEYLTDIEMINFFSHNIRGAINEVMCRQIKANCEELKCFSGNSSERKHIFSADCNGLYPGVLMESYLPFSNYAWMTTEEIDSLDILNYSETGEYGYTLCCSLIYPKEFIERDLQFPLLPYKKTIKSVLHTPIQKQIYNEINVGTSKTEVSKVIMDFCKKEEYVVEIGALKYYLQKGIKIEKIISGIKYVQKPWLKEVFKYLFSLRKNAKINGDSIGYLVLKNIQNRFFGVSLTSTEKYVDTRICRSTVDAKKWLSEHHFMNYRILNKNEGVSLFFMRKGTVHYSKPIALSFLALDRSKIEVYKFWDILKATFPGIKLSYIDTDSVFASIPDPDNKYLTKLQKLNYILDFSNLECKHPLYNNENEGRPLFWKLEYPNCIELLCVRPKAYSALLFCEKCNSTGEVDCTCSFVKTASGVPSHIKSKLTHDYYRNYIFNKEKIELESNCLKINGSELTITPRTINALSSLTSGRILLEDGITTVPFGYRSNRPIPDLIPI